jgi:protein-S-isoprenylcysteine O-methyltransferase Ste14
MRAYVAFLAIVVYLVFVFAIRSWLHRRATGSTGFRGGRGAGAYLFALGAILLALSPILAGLELDELVFTPRVLTDLLGASAMIIGGVGTWWSQSSMGESWRIGVRDGERTELVTRGPFRWMRNPIFTFMLLAAAGFALILPNRSAISAFAMLLGAVELQVRFIEEPHLLRIHGESYRAYCRRVGRFFPSLR